MSDYAWWQEGPVLWLVIPVCGLCIGLGAASLGGALRHRAWSSMPRGATFVVVPFLVSLMFNFPSTMLAVWALGMFITGVRGPRRPPAPVKGKRRGKDTRRFEHERDSHSSSFDDGPYASSDSSDDSFSGGESGGGGASDDY